MRTCAIAFLVGLLDRDRERDTDMADVGGVGSKMGRPAKAVPAGRLRWCSLLYSAVMCQVRCWRDPVAFRISHHELSSLLFGSLVCRQGTYGGEPHKSYVTLGTRLSDIIPQSP